MAAALFIAPTFATGVGATVMETCGVLLLILGAIGRLWAYVHIGGRKNRELCQSGPYACCRNPLYFFSFLGVCGASIALRIPALGLLTAIAFLLLYGRVIEAEETRLADLFGNEYTDYFRRVPRFWPHFQRNPDEIILTLSSRLLERTLREVAGFLGVIAVIHMIDRGKALHWWPTVSLPW